MNKIKRIIFLFLYFLLSLIFIFGSLELFLRINKNFGYINQSFKLLKNEESEAKYFPIHHYRPSKLLGYEYIPNSKFGNFSINSYGLIGKEYNLKKDKDIFRILLLGDSIAAQHWSCLYLEELLNKDYELKEKYKRFEIWNAGTGSYDVRRYALFLKYRGLKFNPDMILIFLFMNDLYPDLNIYYKTKNGAVAYYFPLSEISKKYSVNPFLLKHSYLYRFVILRLNQYLLNKKLSSNNYRIEEGVYYLNIIKEICENNKIKLLIVVFPYLKKLTDYEKWQKEQYNDILTALNFLKLPYINLYDFLPEENLINLRVDDDIHPNEEGHKIIAKIIYNYILKYKLIE